MMKAARAVIMATGGEKKMGISGEVAATHGKVMKNTGKMVQDSMMTMENRSALLMVVRGGKPQRHHGRPPLSGIVSDAVDL